MPTDSDEDGKILVVQTRIETRTFHSSILCASLYAEGAMQWRKIAGRKYRCRYPGLARFPVSCEKILRQEVSHSYVYSSFKDYQGRLPARKFVTIPYRFFLGSTNAELSPPWALLKRRRRAQFDPPWTQT